MIAQASCLKAVLRLQQYKGDPKKPCSHSVEETEIEFEEAMAARICGAEN